MLAIPGLFLCLFCLRSVHSIPAGAVNPSIKNTDQLLMLEQYEKEEGNIQIGVAVNPESGTRTWPWDHDLDTCTATEPNSNKWLLVGKCSKYEDQGVSLHGAAWTLGTRIYNWQTRKLCGPFTSEEPIGNGVNFAIKYAATGRNCDTTATSDHLVRALEEYMKTELHGLLCGGICIKISHGGTWNGYALFGTDKNLVFTAPCDESIVDWKYCRSTE